MGDDSLNSNGVEKKKLVRVGFLSSTILSWFRFQFGQTVVGFPSVCFYAHFRFVHKNAWMETENLKNSLNIAKKVFTLEWGGKVDVSTKGKCK